MKLLFVAICALGFATSVLAREVWEADDLNPVTLHPSPQHEPVAVSSLWVPGKDAPNVSEAVAELQTCVKLATGAELPITDKLTSASTLVIGDCDEAAQLGLISSKLPPEGFVIKTAPNRIFIVGDTKTGGLAWGVYEFIERFIGARWYFPGDAGRFVPTRQGAKRQGLKVPPIWLEDKPFFRKHEIWPPVGKPENGTGVNLMPIQTALRSGDSWPHKLVVHTPVWSGVEEYKKNRPEIYQLTEAGQRDWTMLCYSNPKTLETYLEQIAKKIAGDPSANIGMIGDTITVCPNDAELACYCKDCRAALNKTGGEYGTASSIVASFTARLAAEVQKRWPDKTVLQLAYVNYTDAPDGITFPGNVELQVCGMPGVAMYKEPAIYAHEQANVDRWMKLTGRKIQNWHYSCWPENRTHAVYLFPHVLQKYYRDNRDKTVGTFINGEQDHWPRQHLTLYCWLKLLWNPDFNVDAAIDGYCRNMYGLAADSVRELVKLQIDGWENSRWPGGKLTATNVYTISYLKPTLDRMKNLIGEIREKTKDDPMLAARVAYYTAPFDAMFKEAADVVDAKRTALNVMRVEEAPRVDGKLDDPQWQRAQPASFISGYDREHPRVKYPTTIQAVSTNEGVTFAFRMSEPDTAHLQRSRTGRDNSTLWWDDNVELLLDVTGKGAGDYYHIIVSAAGVVGDARGNDYFWNLPGIKTAVNVAQREWTLEVFVPFAGFDDANTTGENWQGNFTRHRMAGLVPPDQQPGSVEEYQRLNTTFAGPSNNLSDFGPIIFRH